MKYLSLSRFELLLRRLVEEPFAWFNGETPDAAALAAYLWRLVQESRGESTQPVRAVVLMSVEQYSHVSGQVDALCGQVLAHMALLAEADGEPLPIKRVQLEADSTLSGRRIVVAFLDEHDETGPRTALLQHDGQLANLEAIRLADAFLIIQGRHHVALDRPVIRIGRRVDNDIVLDSAAVSRQHAQIRWRQSQFILHNVSSRGRTAVNGVPVEEHVLRPGDVIALSDVLLVYGEGRDEQPSSPLQEIEEQHTLLRPPL